MPSGWEQSTRRPLPLRLLPNTSTVQLSVGNRTGRTQVGTELHQRAALVVLPPGSGKTRLAAEDAKRADAKSVLYVAHTHEILDVVQSEFAAVFGKDNIRRHTKAGDLRHSTRVNLATIQLLRHNLAAIARRTFDYVVIDEFHHAAAASYRKLLDRVSAAGPFLLGLTATPFRGDQQDIAELCGGNIVANFDLRGGIDCGVLSPYHYYGCFDDIDYSELRHNGTRYDVRDLERALIVPERDTAIVRQWRRRAEDKPTLAFCCSHRHAKRVAESFSANGIPAAVYLSTTARAERQELIERAQDGDVKVLCVVDVVNEGADFPFVECLLFLRPTESKRIFYQQLGRGLRRFVGKSHCLVVDFIGNFKNAYRVVEYQGLLPFREEGSDNLIGRPRSEKDVLNLPLGCKVEFDERVIDIFAQQSLHPAHITRHNIARVLVYQYRRLQRRLNREPTRKDVDRNLLLHSEFYKLVFGSWKRFEQVLAAENEI
jgi:superfamily II DNA or RNA helicase